MKCNCSVLTELRLFSTGAVFQCVLTKCPKPCSHLILWHLICASIPIKLVCILTQWDWVTHCHICICKLTIIGSDDGLLPAWWQAIVWTNAGVLLIGTNFSEILITIETYSFKKMRLKISSVKWRPFCLCLNVLTPVGHYRKHYLVDKAIVRSVWLVDLNVHMKLQSVLDVTNARWISMA